MWRIPRSPRFTGENFKPKQHTEASDGDIHVLTCDTVLVEPCYITGRSPSHGSTRHHFARIQQRDEPFTSAAKHCSNLKVLN